MSEDVSATMRVGITVILVAALVAVVLNLMVMSNSLLSNGQTTLQSGIDSVSAQEFNPYDNTKVSGTQVSTALSLFQGRDVAILIQTKALREVKQDGSKIYGNAYINYGAICTSNGQASNDNNKGKQMVLQSDAAHGVDGGTLMMSCESFNGITGSYAVQGTTSTGKQNENIVQGTCKTAVIATVTEGTNPASGDVACVYREAGASYYTGALHNTSGMVDSSYDTIGTSTLGNAAYLLSSARFSSILIKDQTGSIIGIVFKQLN